MILLNKYLCFLLEIMKILLVSATLLEIKPLIDLMGISYPKDVASYTITYNKKNIDVVITGIGMVATTYEVSKQLSISKYDLAINLGVAGSLKRNLKIGTVVNVVSDVFSELGAESGEKFLPLSKLKIPEIGNFTESIKNRFSIKNRVIQGMEKVKGITVNTVHGNTETIRKIKKRLNPDVESMEGAAFLYCCLKQNIPCLQIRSISNYIEERNKNNWNISLAVRNLAQVGLELLNTIKK